MNKNIIRIAVFACVPLNLAMSMEKGVGEEHQGYKRERSDTIVNSGTSDSDSDRDHGFKLKRTLSSVAENQPNVAEAEPKFKGFYPANSTSKDIFSRVPLSKFFMQFDPSSNAEETAKALMEYGVSTSSSPEIVQEKYKDHLTQLIRDENEDPTNYVYEISRMLLFFNEMYSGIVKPYIGIAEKGASSVDDTSSVDDASSENDASSEDDASSVGSASSEGDASSVDFEH